MLRLRLPRAPRPATWLWLLLAVLASAPAWIVRYPPLQDMPFHVAALRVIGGWGNPTYAFARDYVLNLGGTQYVLYYLVGSVLSWITGPAIANVALASAYLGGTPLAIREVLRALGKDERIALLAVPFLVNPMFLFGFMPFLLGVPLAFLGVAATVRWNARPSPARGAWLAVLGVAVFYAHVFPFGLFGLAFALLFPWGEPRRWLVAGLPVVPALLLLVWWTGFSPAGKASRGALGGSFAAAPLDQALSAIPQWTCNVFRDNSDEQWFLVGLAVIAVALFLAQGDGDPAKPPARRLAFLPVALGVGYFATGEYLGPVWLFAQRFPVLALLAAIPLLRFPRGARGAFVTALALAVGGASTWNACKHFLQFQLEEVGDFDLALASMEPGKRVATLVYDRWSTVVHWAPFLHFGSYYQARKGGLVQFSYADWSHWPFQYRPGFFPPPGTPTRKRWEWTPEEVPMAELFPFYDYVLVRGHGFAPPPGTFHVTFRGDRWTVFRRDGT